MFDAYRKHRNAVYILGSDRRMRYGKVVDVADNGLFVDLLCPNRGREFVPFDSVFSPRTTSIHDTEFFLEQEQVIVAVEILVPETPSGPWIWVPGEMRYVRRSWPHAVCGGAVVHWLSPDAGVSYTDMVSAKRIRPPCDVAGYLRLAECSKAVDEDDGYCFDPDKHPLFRDRIRQGNSSGAFMTRSADLGEKFRSLTTAEAASLIKRLKGYDIDFYSPVFVVDLKDGKLKYVYQLLCKEISDQRYTEQMMKAIGNFHQRLVGIVKYLTEETPRIDDEVALPVELWQEVFSHLNTVTQTMLGAVCTTWNQIMNAPVLRYTIVVRNDDYSTRDYDFLSLAMVYQRLRAGTNRVIITSPNDRSWTLVDGAMMVGDMMHYVAAPTGLRLRTVHLRRVKLQLMIYGDVPSAYITDPHRHHAFVDTPKPSTAESSQSSYLWMEEFIAGCRSLPCDAIHIANCPVTLVCSFFLEPEHWRTAVKFKKFDVEIKTGIRSARLPLGGDFGCTLWDALEAALPFPDVQELQNLQQRLEERGKETENQRTAVCKMLCAVQSCDPRPTTHYRGKNWCVDGLGDLQLDKLSRTTLHFLVEVQKKTVRERW